MANTNKYLSYSKTKELVNSLNNIKSALQFSAWHKKNKPQNIPFHPERHYKNSGWINWMEFLETNNVWGSNRKHTVNDNYFKKWSNNMAYILGFWFADGYMNEKHNLFSITQHKKDAYILNYILKELDSNYTLSRHGNDSFDFRIISKEIVKDIKRLGGCERKSLIVKFPKIPKKYLSHFARGLWDGDGSIYYNKQYKRYASSFMSGSECFIYSFCKLLNKSIKNFDCKIYKNAKGYLSLAVGINDTVRLFEFIYKNSNHFKLERKYELFKKTGEIRTASFNKIFKSFKEAKMLAIKNKIKTSTEWEEKYKNISKCLPANPECAYKNQWHGWNDFLGTKIWTYKKAQNYVKALKLKSSNEWRKYARSKRIKNIPSNPWTYYKEWNGLKGWLGIK